MTSMTPNRLSTMWEKTTPLPDAPDEWQMPTGRKIRFHPEEATWEATLTVDGFRAELTVKCKANGPGTRTKTAWGQWVFVTVGEASRWRDESDGLPEWVAPQPEWTAAVFDQADAILAAMGLPPLERPGDTMA